mmetsp:Transcript_56552/g.123991  ORF Transcript_56552/g.123991 Transcript_56552/m.123991 type:complete len:713 (+) Transcript_56552:53-2191(+)|eukprot:CAMPEP_0204392422 /NCGR_PEP_ID=MMETSP0469-20131031/61748_1 /ASSEMBLY_ACC=CAM_ASM_000384 /TAXON_ID=2969 /ORGANISM="Oxyrrhis marina" /LENGTH=712 /DNA_ID=CAMNT_0051386399 /DNA_START=53 /DNA_END=2191 /DNA_ORIENTATION=-
MRAIVLPLAGASATLLAGNPISRVVDLLKGLADKLSADAKEEQKLYNKYECWCTTTLREKTAAISAAEVQITAKNNYIEELDSGRVEMTSERSGLEEQIQTLKSDIKTLDDERTADAAKFAEASLEATQTIDALKLAIPKLDSAISGHTEGVFFAFSDGLAHAIRRSSDRLSEQDARFFDELTTEDDPNAKGTNWDQKKLNRKATFKMAYKARSQKIRQILVDLQEATQAQLDDITATENAAITSYSGVRTAKKAELTAAVSAKNTGAEEAAARAKAKQQAQDEVSALRTGKTDDERFKSQTELSCKNKATEFAARSADRKEEIASVNEAISILHNDDARDVLNRSRGFVQLSSRSQSSRCVKKRAQLAAVALEKIQTRSFALTALASMVQRAGTSMRNEAFANILAQIEKMVTNLRAEQDSDLQKKEDCEAQRSNSTIQAKELSQTIDNNEARIEELKSDNTRLQQEVLDTQEEISQLQEQKKELKNERDAEHAEFLTSKLDDETAASLVQQAYDVLNARRRALNGESAPVTTSGAPPSAAQGRLNLEIAGGATKLLQQAPPPPPATFSGSYKGSRGETGGILTLLQTLKEDIEKDITKAVAEEQAAVASYTHTMADLASAITAKNAMITTTEGTIADNEEEISNRKTTISNDDSTLQGTMNLLKQITPGCDFIAVQYPTRTENRNKELDGLKKAKAILQGATMPSLLQGC